MRFQTNDGIDVQAIPRVGMGEDAGPPERCVRYGTASNFNFDALIDDRRRHETEESKASVAARYRQAMAEGLFLGTKLSSTKTSKPSSKTSMTAALISQITHLASLALTSSNSSAKAASEGAEKRLSRWKSSTAGVTVSDNAPAHEAANDVPPSVDASTETIGQPPLPLISDILKALHAKKDTSLRTLALTHRRRLLRIVQLQYSNMSSTYDFEDTGLNHFHPLRIGSWVVVVDRKRIHIGTGMSTASTQMHMPDTIS
jgi:hypothetical protein